MTTPTKDPSKIVVATVASVQSHDRTGGIWYRRHKKASGELERLREAAEKACSWFERVAPETEEVADYLNEDGWEDMLAIAADLRTVLGTPAGKEG